MRRRLPDALLALQNRVFGRWLVDGVGHPGVPAGWDLVAVEGNGLADCTLGGLYSVISSRIPALSMNHFLTL